MLIGLDVSRLGVAQRTGTEHYTWELLAALGQMDRHNQYLLYANRRPRALPPLPPRFHLRSLPWPRLWTHLRLSAEMLLHPPDVLHIPAHVLPLVHPQRSVVTIHDLGYLYYPQAHTLRQRLYLRWSTSWSARHANHLLADSEATKQDLVRFCRVPAEKITVVYLGVSSRFAPTTDGRVTRSVMERYGVRPPYLLFVGTVQPRKNLRRLIAAFAQADVGEFQLVLAGKRGWLTAEIDALGARLGVADRVHFTGYVADADVPVLLGGARALLLPSLYEGFGLTALEAMACGTPVLAARSSSLPEVVGDAGLLVDPLDVDDMARGLERIALDDTAWETLQARGLRRVTDWSWSRCARETLSVLEAVGKE